MDRGDLYLDDLYAWTEQQAAALRRLAGTRRDLPNDLDLEHVAEEIEDLGSSQRDTAESYIRLILVHLIKLALRPDAPAVKHWRGEIVSFHIDLLSKLTPAMEQRIDLDRLWRLAKRQARARLDEEDTLDDTAPIWQATRCPLEFHVFALDDFDIEQALTSLKNLDRPEPLFQPT